MAWKIVFDVGRVLLDWDPRYLYRKIFEDLGQMEWFLENVCTMEWNDQHDRGVPFAQSISTLSKRYPKYQWAIEAFGSRWEEMMGEPIAGSVAIAKELHESHFPLYVLSNFSAEKFPMIRRKHDFFNWFSGIFLSGEVGLIKPDPRIYRRFLERFGLQAEECVFIDDRGENVQAAKEVGMDSIGFENPEQLRQELLCRKLLK